MRPAFNLRLFRCPRVVPHIDIPPVQLHAVLYKFKRVLHALQSFREANISLANQDIKFNCWCRYHICEFSTFSNAMLMLMLITHLLDKT